MIGSPCAYLSRNRRAIVWVSNYRCLIGYPGDSHINYARFNGFLLKVSYSFQTYENATNEFT